MSVVGVSSTAASRWALVNANVSDTAANVVRVGSKLSTLQQVTVTDTAARVQSTWQSLVTLANMGKLDAIALSDNVPQLTLKASQFATGGNLLALLGNGVAVSVLDTAANVTAMIAPSGATLSQTSVKDTAANTLRQWDRLAAMAKAGDLQSVTLTDRKPAFTLSAAQFASSAELRAQLSNATFAIKDTAANLAAHADALQSVSVQLVDTVQGANDQAAFLGTLAQSGQLKSVKLSGSGTLSLSAAQASAMGSLVAVNFQVRDTAANIQSNFTALAGLKRLTQVNLTDTARPTLSVTDAQYKSGAKLLAKISGAAVSVKFAGNAQNYNIKSNADGSFSVGNAKYKSVNFFEFADYTTFADTGDASLNAMLSGGTDFWWASGQAVKSSDVQIKPGVFALDSSSARHTLTYSFLQSLPASAADGRGFQPMSDTQKQAVKDALSYLSSLVNLRFEEATGAQVGAADINFGTNNQSLTNSAGYANPPNGSGDHPVYLMLDNSGRNPNTNFSAGSYGWQTLIHEIGHTLGFKHPGNYNATGGGSPGPYLPKATDTRRYTVMSYNNPTDAVQVVHNTSAQGVTTFTPKYVYPQTYMSYDIAALQYLYGVGDGAGVANYQVNEFSADWSGMQTLWMPSEGSVDASRTTRSNIIDLRAGAFSSINLTSLSDLNAIPTALRKQVTYMGLNNVGLAYGSEVTSAKGGAANDTFFDAATSGTVTIDAGAGANDLVYLAGTAADWVRSNDGASYANSKLQRTVTMRGVDTVRYYDANTYKSTHASVDVLA
jgi:serralysin